MSRSYSGPDQSAETLGTLPQSLVSGRALPGGFGSRRVAIRIEEHTLMSFDPLTRELLRARKNPLTAQ